MSIMQPILTSFMTVVFLAPGVPAQVDSAATASRNAESFQALKEEYDAAMRAWKTDVDAAHELAKKNGKANAPVFTKPSPGPLFATRFLALAERNLEAPEAIDALILTLQTSLRSTTGPAHAARGKAIKILSEHFAAKPPIMGFLRLVSRYGHDDAMALIAQVIAQNPDREIQLAAYKA